MIWEWVAITNRDNTTWVENNEMTRNYQDVRRWHTCTCTMRCYKMVWQESKETAESDGITWCEMMWNDIHYDII